MKKLERKSLFGTFAVLACLTACKTPIGPELSMPPIRYPEPGWQTFPSPRNFDFPGSMFSIDSAGVWRPLPAAGTNYAVQGRAELATLRTTNHWSANVLLKYLGAKNIGIDFTNNTLMQFEVQLENNQRYWDPEFYSKTLQAAKASITNAPPGTRYFVIEVTHAFRGITVKSTETGNGQIAGRGLVAQLADAGAGFARNRFTESGLVKTFHEDYNVFFLAHEIKWLNGGMPGSGVSSKPVKEHLAYKLD